MIVILIGYMASGKSSIGVELSKKINFDFIDLDDFIEERENAKINTIFKDKGEIYFRKVEHQLLKEILNTKTNLVLSLGGGTPCYAGNMSLINNRHNVSSFYLKAKIKTITERLYKEKDSRPLVAHIVNEETLYEFIGKHLFERAPYYEQSNNSIVIDDLDIEEIVEKIVLQLF